jgi:hypothetical protein
MLWRGWLAMGTGPNALCFNPSLERTLNDRWSNYSSQSS